MFAWLKSWSKKTSGAPKSISAATQPCSPRTIGRHAQPNGDRMHILSGRPAAISATSGPNVTEGVKPINAIDYGTTHATVAQAMAVEARIKRRGR
jgi:hypothetical protein